MQEQLKFLKNEYIQIISKADTSAQPKWGKMNFQQMVEHVAAFFKVSTHKLKFDLVSPPEHMPKLKEFLMSDKQFRENTKAPTSIIGEEPFPVHFTSPEEAVAKLEKEVSHFFHFYETNPTATAVHPVFGELNFEEWVRLHYKHVTHHLRQFGLMS
ncbi:DinB family protein [Lacibacter sediminis]|uniref:DinB family protein n=1 Tax=Lacibacter sediminis TaxID=2760713 RepID=A0A7G5XH67_9BACT|nr:DinB family protein [Lacibacter sediminis]QNA44820.1 DinB family protein [Lacibacter sediminis]